MLAVANFHYIRKSFETEYPSIFGVTPDRFRKQLQKLAKYGQFVSQKDILKGISEDKKAILITFDDGLKEQFELAKPILDEMKIPFICFVNTSNFSEKKVSLVHQIHLLRSRISPVELRKEIEKKWTIKLSDEEKNKAIIHYNYDEEEVARLKYLLNFRLGFEELRKIISPLFKDHFDKAEMANELYMGEEQLAELWGEGSLGSHGHYHDPLGMLPAEKVKKELEKSQEFFISRFGGRAKAFSYPYGSFEACKNLSIPLAKTGYEMAFSMERAINKNPAENPFLLGRYDCNDLPGGKANLFQRKNLFENPEFSNWHRYENGTSYQQ
ncbi:hypothetical protein C7S20_00245 [Christiangramia fulva]|uniref:NodB homology domain-containing protein n=1 Tax=Christiangramia fulva TaxID=2126553 RepID=A0A2R3Z0P2_9FLAO|nr:polysaccharide deacetylase family protein [Christiangramia fulva]AVR43825.1 hypothetical protein C7S20_00245 [Christiangramia fulva]